MEPLRPTDRTAYPESEAPTVALLFTDPSEAAPWYERLLSPGFAHVDMLVINPGHAVLLESYGGALKVTDLELHRAERLIERWPGPVVELLAQARRPPWLPLGPTTCVTLAKAVIGCPAWWVQTPRQLAKWAAANGGWMR